jgi:uncharacterized Zn finger protein
MHDYWGWKPRTTVAERRRQAELEKSKLRKKGRDLAPIVIVGRKIAHTFWGTAWCKNLESYSDYENRLPRGRSYVRNGLVLHLEIAGGSITALVRGSSLYTVSITIASVPKAHWNAICGDSAGAIDSLVELLQGRLSTSVMERISRQNSGLFPAPKEIKFACSCPDVASMCKHVSAVLYGVGARLDEQPELLFRLRQVDEKDLISAADVSTRLTSRGPSKNKLLAGANLSELFGLQLGADEEPRAPKKAASKRSTAQKRTRAKKASAKKASAKKATAKKASAKKTSPKKAPDVTRASGRKKSASKTGHRKR